MRNAITAAFAALLSGSLSLSALGQNTAAATGEWCELGLLYQISYQANWGDSHAIVADVVPGSPAFMQGVKAGDIILTIDGRDTREMSDEEITAALSDPNKGFLTLGLARFNNPDLKVNITKVCHPSGALDEKLVARAFNMYSLEDVVDRSFTLPLKHNVPTAMDFLAYKSFSFESGAGSTPIARHLAKQLTAKGLLEKTVGGDLIVRYAGDFGANENLRPGSDANLNPDFKNYRYDARYDEVREFPFLSINTPAFSGLNALTLEIQIVEAKSGTLLWSVSARELLNTQYSPEDYVAAYAPMLLANFPFTRYLSNPTFIHHDHTFRYTGISYDAEDLQVVKEVIKDSPAYKAGIRVGDRIYAINGLPLDRSIDKMTEDYQKFLKDSWDMRDKGTLFPSTQGFRSSMYWKVDKYAEVATMLQDPKYHSAFAYLFSHRSYVSGQPIEEIVFDIDRGGESLSLLVKPILLNLDYLELR